MGSRIGCSNECWMLKSPREKKRSNTISIAQTKPFYFSYRKHRTAHLSCQNQIETATQIQNQKHHPVYHFRISRLVPKCKSLNCTWALNTMLSVPHLKFSQTKWWQFALETVWWWGKRERNSEMLQDNGGKSCISCHIQNFHWIRFKMILLWFQYVIPFSTHQIKVILSRL